MKIYKSITILLISLFATEALSRTTLVHAELDKYDSAKRIVVIEGKAYRINIDIGKSEYNNEIDAPMEVKPRELRVGQKYYFNLYANPKISKDDFNEVIFIASEEPGE